jgi:hypothetical protein
VCRRRLNRRFTLSSILLQIAYNLLARFITSKSIPLLDIARPSLQQHLSYLEATFGPPATFTPSVTHVLLVAIMLVLLANGDGRRR